MVKVSTPVKWVLRILALGYVFFLVAWPVSQVVIRRRSRTASTT